MLGLRIVPDVLSGALPATAAVDEPIACAAQRLAEAGAPALAVTDAAGRVVGLLTEAALVRLVAVGGDPAATTVDAVMTPIGDRLAPDDTPLDALELMRVRGVRLLPVFAEDRCLGIVGTDALCAVLADAVRGAMQQAAAAIFETPRSVVEEPQ